jgi:hypothetical protein
MSRFESGRPDGRFVSTAGFVHAYLKANPPRLAFRPSIGVEGCPAWQAEVRDKLREVMHFPGVPDQPPPQHLWTEERDGYRLEKWEAYPEPLSVVPFLVLVPDGACGENRVPGVLCFPGSVSSKESLAGEPELDPERPVRPHWARNRMAMWYAQAGLVAVAVDNPGIGELSDPLVAERHEICVNGLWAGRHYEGLSVFQKLPILEWLRGRPYIDPERIAVSGHSLGAKPALILAVLDPGIAALVWNDFCSRWRERAIAENLMRISIHQYVPELLEWFDYTDLMASLAPRPLLIAEGGRTRDIEGIRAAYRLVGAEGNIEVEYYPKYARPEDRPFDDADLPEGLDMETYFEYANVDVPEHSFKENVAVPWLSRVLSLDGR